MRQRPLGTTSVEVPELTLGTWGLSGDGYGPVAETEQERVILRARALGITLFETADCYAQGAMESRLGDLLGTDSETRFVTKIGNDVWSTPARKRFDRKYLAEATLRSAERLKRKRIDILLLHNPSLATLERNEATTALDELRGQGRVGLWGVSAGSSEVARAALERGAQVISLAYNLFFPRDLTAIGAELVAKGAGLFAHSVLAYGLLTGLWANDKQFAPLDHRAERWTPDELRLRIRQLDALRPSVAGPIVSLRALALRFVLANEQVGSAILGPRSALQLDQLVREAGKVPPYLPEGSIAALRARLESHGVQV